MRPCGVNEPACRVIPMRHGAQDDNGKSPISKANAIRQQGRERQRLEFRSDTPETVCARLAALAPRLFGAGATLHALQRLSGGASQELWSFDIAAGGALHGLILRRHPPGTAARAQTATMAQEACIIGLAAAAGAPVPRVVHGLEPSDQLGTGYIMQRVEGETLAPRILRDAAYAQARPRLARQLGAAAFLIHTIHAPDLRHIPRKAWPKSRRSTARKAADALL